MAQVVLATACLDFDPTEVAVPWRILTTAGHVVSFATADGKSPEPDPLMLTGKGLDLWGFVPGLRNLRGIGRILGADTNAQAAYRQMAGDPNFLAPVAFADLDPDQWDGLILPGGHRARGIRPYLEDLELRRFVVSMFELDKPVGAICHGTVVAARAISSRTGKSVLFGRKTTSLTWAQEQLATRIANVTRFWDRHYYRTYQEGPGEPVGYRSVQAEVTRALATSEDYLDVPSDAADFGRKTNGRHRDTPTDNRPAFVVRDRNYLSARWPGDAHTFAKTFCDLFPHESHVQSPTPTIRHP